jgi:hypothetical protein
VVELSEPYGRDSKGADLKKYINCRTEEIK